MAYQTLSICVGVYALAVSGVFERSNIWMRRFLARFIIAGAVAELKSTLFCVEIKLLCIHTLMPIFKIKL